MLKYLTWVPPGHFYSPIHDIKEVERFKHIFLDTDELPEIENTQAAQIDLLESFVQLYSEFPYFKRDPNLLYQNPGRMFDLGDALSLYFFIRAYEPKRIIEIGSGFSSAIMYDLNTIFFNDEIELNFIDPYFERIPDDQGFKTKCNLVKDHVQNLDVEFFQRLDSNDILFVDSSHVSKACSDVNHIMFNILPHLSKDVIIHFHDIGYNFEYSLKQLEKGISWNESYLLRAFLMYNDSFKIMLQMNRLLHAHQTWIKQHMPIYTQHNNGSIWLQKVK